jgi:hypothetical protein
MESRFAQPSLALPASFDALSVRTLRTPSPSKERDELLASPLRMALRAAPVDAARCAADRRGCSCAAMALLGALLVAALYFAAGGEPSDASRAIGIRFDAASPRGAAVRAVLASAAVDNAAVVAELATLTRCLTGAGTYARGPVAHAPYVPGDVWQNSCERPTDAALAHSTRWGERRWVDWRWVPTNRSACAAPMATFYADLAHQEHVRAQAARGVHARLFGRLVARAPSPLCAALGQRSVVFVGDSMTFQAFTSFALLAGSTIKPAQNWDEFELRFDPSGEARRISLCGGRGASVRYIRNNELTLARLNESAKCGKKNFCRPWLDSTRDDDVLVLNRGAHVVGIDDRAFGAEMRALASALGSAGRRASQLVFWRTTPMGHARCDAPEAVAPRTAPRDAAELAALPYDWGRFAVHNAAAVRALRAEPALRGRLHIVDAAVLSAPRRDRHQAHSKPRLDCLHYCLPSTIDDWSRWIIAALAARGGADAQRGASAAAAAAALPKAGSAAARIAEDALRYAAPAVGSVVEVEPQLF